MCNELARRNEPDDEGRPQGAAAYGCLEALLSPDDDLIALLSEDAAPVSRLRIWPLVLIQLVIMAGMLAIVGLFLGVRADVATADPLPQLILREGVLAVAATLLYASAIREAYPGVWTPVPFGLGLGAVAVLPGLAALSMLLWDRDSGNATEAMAEFGDFWRCARSATALALPGILVHVWWLRNHGAVTSPHRAAFSTGLAGGAAALFAFGISCPSTHWLYAGVTYPLVMAAVALVTWLALARWLRW